MNNVQGKYITAVSINKTMAQQHFRNQMPSKKMENERKRDVEFNGHY